MNGDVPPVGVLVTPTHPPGPDFDAAIRLLEGLGSVHDVAVPTTELERRSAATRRHYELLAQRVQSLREGEEATGRREYPDDRMYM